MIKGMSTVWWLAKMSNREFAIRFKHEIGLLYSGLLGNLKPDMPVINLIDKKSSDNILELLNGQFAEKDIAILCNGGLDHFKKYENYLENIRPFFNKFYREILPIGLLEEKEEEPFQVLHCRMGDVYLKEATNKMDNRIGGQDILQIRLGIFLKQFAGGSGGGGSGGGSIRTLICCDNKEILDLLLKVVPNSFSVCRNPYHFAYNTRVIGQQEIMKSIRETMAEHEQMSRASRIIMLAYSGFPIISALIGNVSELLIIDETVEKGWKHYKNDWTI